jgi:hypothetical protein
MASAKEARMDGLCLLLAGMAIFVAICSASEWMGIAWMIDFKSVYYGTRCMIEHRDPYQFSELMSVYQKESGADITNPVEQGRSQAQLVYINLPTAFVFLAPFGVLSWGLAHFFWMAMTCGSFLVSAFLIWRLASQFSPILSGGLAAVWLVNGLGVFLVGNTAGIAVNLCIIAALCFTTNRFARIGVLCLALSLTIKPQDAGLIWLFFLLAGGTYRRRALETLCVTAFLSALAILWVHQVSPGWFHELRANLHLTMTGPNAVNNPVSTAVNVASVGMMISLQTVFGVFWKSAFTYNTITYLTCGGLILVWAASTVRSHPTTERVWFGLAAIAAISMLPVYHRTHDANLISLALPACAILSAKRSPFRRAAIGLTVAALLLTGDLPLYFLVNFSRPIRDALPDWLGKAATILLARPAPLILLAMGSFYLWVYMRDGQKCNADKIQAESISAELAA